jgi:hypothetical protein
MPERLGRLDETDKAVASPRWQKGFFDHILRSEDSYSEKWNYVRENPGRTGLVTAWSDCPFSREIFEPRVPERRSVRNNAMVADRRYQK